MKTWRCPSCGHEQKCRASEVAHRCPKNRNKMTQYVLVVPGPSPTIGGPVKKGRNT